MTSFKLKKVDVIFGIWIHNLISEDFRSLNLRPCLYLILRSGLVDWMTYTCLHLEF